MALLITNSGALANQISPHKAQLSNPTELLELKIKAGVTKIIGASTIDLNAIHTPFDQPRIIKKVNEEFTTSGRVIYFQPKEQAAFSIYITDKADPDAPIYKLTIAPSPVPVGLQVKLIPLDNYVSKRTKKTQKMGDSYPSKIITSLASTAKYLADGDTQHIPIGFHAVSEWDSPQFYIGNSLVVPSQKLSSSDFEILVFELVNRDNVGVEYVHSDFAMLPASVAELAKNDKRQQVTTAGVTFYPHTKVVAGGQTQVIVMRSK